MDKKLSHTLAYTLSAALLIISAEVVVRLNGIDPWQPKDISIEVEPGGKFFTKHADLGYTHIPGTFTVRLSDDYAFKVTHLPDTLRITQPLNAYKRQEQKDELWIFGGSYTHGWSLNDEETYPWLLQKGLHSYTIVNFGVSGYGTLHSLIQLRNALKHKLPKVVIVSYASSHDPRNTFARIRRKNIAPWNKLGPLVQPYARLDQNGMLQFSMAKVEYRPFPIMKHSALMHFFEQLYNIQEYKSLNSHTVSERLILEMARIARSKNISFVVAGITQREETRAMLEFCRNNGINTVDIAINLTEPGNRNLPHDSHPSATANKIYAEKLEDFLTKTGLTQSPAGH